MDTDFRGFMKKLLSLYILCVFCCFHLEGTLNSNYGDSEVLFEITTPIGTLIAYRPDAEEMQRTAPAAKVIFQEAFSTTYKEYHRKSGSMEPIEKWLRLRDGLTLESWLSHVFDEEYEECLGGSKKFIYFCGSEGHLIGWLSHGLMTENGDIYLSQCAFEADSRNQKVATAVIVKALKPVTIKTIFPEAKELKLITRKINQIANHLFTKAGFARDETIDPSVYGDSYDDRYVGYRLVLEEK